MQELFERSLGQQDTPEMHVPRNQRIYRKKTDGVEVHKLAKKERGQYPVILTEQAWSIKDLLYGFRGNFFCGTRGR